MKFRLNNKRILRNYAFHRRKTIFWPKLIDVYLSHSVYLQIRQLDNEMSELRHLRK